MKPISEMPVGKAPFPHEAGETCEAFKERIAPLRELVKAFKSLDASTPEQRFGINAEEVKALRELRAWLVIEATKTPNPPPSLYAAAALTAFDKITHWAFK